MTAPPRDEKLRLFVALELPSAWTRALGELQESMRRTLSEGFGQDAPRLRWTLPEGSHLTMKFLGEQPRSKSGDIDRALREAIKGTEAFTLSLGKIGVFEDRRGPRVIYVGLEGETEPLLSLARQVEAELAYAGFPRERQRFQPHLTLCRLPTDIDPAIRGRIGETLAALRPPRPGPARFKEMALIRSFLEGGGARYQKVRPYKLNDRP